MQSPSNQKLLLVGLLLLLFFVFFDLKTKSQIGGGHHQQQQTGLMYSLDPSQHRDSIYSYSMAGEVVPTPTPFQNAIMMVRPQTTKKSSVYSLAMAEGPVNASRTGVVSNYQGAVLPTGGRWVGHAWIQILIMRATSSYQLEIFLSFFNSGSESTPIE